MAFTLNAMEAIQEKYGTIEAWSNLIQNDGEPDIKALKFFITEAINEGLDRVVNKVLAKERCNIFAPQNMARYSHSLR